MNKPQQKVLLMSADIGKTEQLRGVLPRLGFRLLVAESPAAAATLCRQHDVDLIVIAPLENDSARSFLPRDCPSGIPILYLAAGPFDHTDLPDFCSMLTNPSDEALMTQVKLLSQIRALQRSLANKEREIEELDHLLGQQQQSMKQHSDFLDVLASRDGLTGLYNRRHLNKVLTREFKLAAEQQTDLSLLILDLDFFDELNQRAGRSYGDFVLNDFAARLTSTITPKGLCFRFSGEVFVALLPDTGLDEAVSTAESIRRNLAEKPFIRGTEQHQITLSVGAAALIEHQPTDPDHLITMAERALFLAKSEGRNRVVSFSPIDRPGSSTSQQSIALVKETLSKILEKTKKSAIESLQLLAKDIAGKENQSHVKTVRRYVELIGKQMNLPEPLILTFKNAITLHTSIRLLLHNEMIRKRQEFSTDEREVMNDFPYKLLELTEHFDFFSGERSILLHHAERYDGYGFPEGLKGDEIPLGARFFALVDALAAMNADRPYRKRLQPEEIITQLTEGAGTQFDPDLVVLALQALEKHQLLEVDPGLIDKSIRSLSSRISGRPL
jgi:diguanylate cyclase (GGDEF)-like protein